MRIAHLPGRAPLFLCPADGFASDYGGGEFELGGAGGEAVDAVEKNLCGEGGHIFHWLADACDGRLHIVHIGVVVERHQRQVGGNPQSGLAALFLAACWRRTSNRTLPLSFIPRARRLTKA